MTLYRALPRTADVKNDKSFLLGLGSKRTGATLLFPTYFLQFLIAIPFFVCYNKNNYTVKEVCP